MEAYQMSQADEHMRQPTEAEPYDECNRLRAEATRLRAALAEIAALQTEEPRAVAYNTNAAYYLASGRFEASSLAAAALVSK